MAWLNSIWGGLSILAATFVSTAAIAYWNVSRGGAHHYFFDPKHNLHPSLKQEGGDFGQHAGRYQDLSKFAITISAAAIAFLVNTLINNQLASSPFGAKVAAIAPIACVFFSGSILCLILFVFLQTYFYEEYCHSPDHSSYTPLKYAISSSFGITGLIAFVIGFARLGIHLFG